MRYSSKNKKDRKEQLEKLASIWIDPINMLVKTMNTPMVMGPSWFLSLKENKKYTKLFEERTKKYNDAIQILLDDEYKVLKDYVKQETKDK